MNKKWSGRRKIIFFALAFWSLAILLSLFWNIYKAKEQVLALADIEAKVNLQRDLALRQWATLHGGLYIPVSEYAKPNPYLAHVKDRDVQTPSGETLTLFNPATMIREIHEKQKQLYGALSRITALKILNPINAPDEWEKKALQIIQKTKTDYTELTEIGGRPYLRKMQPMFMEEGCLKCHAWTGIKVGEIRGATDHSVALEPYYEILSQTRIEMIFTHFCIWGLGFGIVFYMAVRNLQAEKDLEEKDDINRSLTDIIHNIVDSAPVGIIVYEVDSGNCVLANDSAAEILASPIEEIRKQNYLKSESWKQSGILDKAKLAIREGKNYQGEFLIGNSGYNQLWISCVFAGFMNDGKKHLLFTFNDITQRKKSEIEIRKLLTAIEQSPTTIVITDLDVKIQYTNPRFTEITGYTIGEVIGKNPRILNSGQTSRLVYEDMWNCLNSGKNWVGEFINKKKNGEIFYEQAFIAPVKNPEGITTHFVSVKLDITERKKMELDLIRSKEDAEKANKAKSDFLATIGHEIRTPIHGMLGFNELLMSMNPGSNQIEYLEKIERSGQSLLGVVDNILNVAELEKDTFSLQVTEFSLKDLINEIRDSYSIKAELKNISFECILSPGTDDFIACDKRRLEQIITNLLDNSIKFTGKGFVRLIVKTEPHTGSESKLIVSVQDSGKGIKNDSIGKIFEIFTQEDTSISRKFGGAGLGLAICKKLVSVMGGDIRVNSVLDEGSDFTFQILYRKVKNTPDSPVLIQRYDSRKDLRVLIAEDDEINLAILVRLLDSLGYKSIETAEDGKIALGKFEAGKFDLLLTDLHMPNMTGFELVENIRNQFNGNLKIIALTADIYEETRMKCFKLGMNGFLTKPFTKQQLKEKIVETCS